MLRSARPWTPCLSASSSASIGVGIDLQQRAQRLLGVQADPDRLVAL
jgi:hypothetical protein